MNALIQLGAALAMVAVCALVHAGGLAGISRLFNIEDEELKKRKSGVETAGLVTNHVEGYAEHYARTLTHWLANLEADLPRAEALVGPERVNVWRLYLRAARNGFETGFTSIYQVRAVAGT